MADETSRRYLFVAIDRATRLGSLSAFTTAKRQPTPAASCGIWSGPAPLSGHCCAMPCPVARQHMRSMCERGQWIRIRTILTDNGKEFTDRLFGLRKRAQSGKHEFDKLCSELDIEHRLVRGFARSGLKRSTGAFPRRPSPPPRSPQANGMVPSHGLKANHCPLPGRACLHAREGGNGEVQRSYRGRAAKPPLPIR